MLCQYSFAGKRGELTEAPGLHISFKTSPYIRVQLRYLGVYISAPPLLTVKAIARQTYFDISVISGPGRIASYMTNKVSMDFQVGREG